MDRCYKKSILYGVSNSCPNLLKLRALAFSCRPTRIQPFPNTVPGILRDRSEQRGFRDLAVHAYKTAVMGRKMMHSSAGSYVQQKKALEA